MKRFSIILLMSILLFGSGTSWADGIMINSYKYASGSSALCSSCTPGDPSDIFCEDFEGPRCSWTESNTGDGDTNPQSTRNQSTMPCTSKGTYNADFYCPSASDKTYYQRAISDTSTLYVQFYFYLESEGLNDSQGFTVYQVESSDEVNAGAVGIAQSGGSLYLFAYANNWSTGPNVGSTALSTGTWYRIGVEYTKNTSNGLRVYLNGTEQTGCRVNTSTQALDKVTFGGGEKAFRYQIDNIQVDDDTMPEACSS